MLHDQETLWRETMAEGLSIEREAQQGGLTPTEVDPRMMHDIASVLSRLAAKSKQLIGNHTTNFSRMLDARSYKV